VTEQNGWQERMDRFERAMGHLLETQAGQQTAIDKLLLLQQRADININRTLDLVESLAVAQRETDEELKATNRIVAELATAQRRTEGAMAETNERLNALIRVVDDIVRRENRN